MTSFHFSLISFPSLVHLHTPTTSALFPSIVMNFNASPLFLASSFSAALWFKLLVSLPFYFWKFCIQWAVTFFGFGPRGLRKIISSNHYLGPDGRLLPGHNLLISLQLHGFIKVSEFREEFMNKCILKRNSKTGQIELPELMEEIVIWGGYPFWKKNDKFDINNHILGWTRDGLLNIAEFEQEILNKEFRREDGSPWKIYLIHDKGQGSTRLIFSFHHSLGDGVSMYGLLMRLSENQNTKVQKVDARGTNPFSILTNFLPPRNPLLCPVPLMKNFLKCSTSLPPFYLLPEGMTDKQRAVVRSNLIKKSTLTMIAGQNRVPFTAVLLSAISGALRKYVVDVAGASAVPDFIFCPMPVPMQNQNKGLSNAIQSVELTLPLGTEDLGQRLQLCGDTLKEAQHSAFPLLVRLSLFIENAYPLTLKPGAGQLPPIILSSFPGPKAKVSMAICNNSHDVLDMDFTWNGCNYVSVVVTTLTYADGIRIVLSADPKAFKSNSSIYSIMEFVENEINKMANK